MYASLLESHSLLRWVVLVGAAVRTAVALHGVATGREPGAVDRRASLVATILTDLQLTLGLLLWFVLSPVVGQARSDLGAAMKDGALRWPLLEHPVLMVLAVIAIHVAHASTKRAVGAASHRRLAVISAVALVLMLVGSFRHA